MTEDKTAQSAQGYKKDPRNDDVLVYVNGELVKRNEARVSLFDAGFVLGDGVWEGLRAHRGEVLFAAAHLARLWEGLKALDIDIGLTQRQLLGMVRVLCVCQAGGGGLRQDAEGCRVQA